MERSLAARDPAERRRAALVLAAVGGAGAVRPLLTAYLETGDASLLSALAGFGRRLTPVIMREAREPGMGGRRLVRLLCCLAVTKDSVAAALASGYVAHPSLPVRIEAAATLAALGDRRGISLLEHDLEGTDPTARKTALTALVDLGTPEATGAVERHLARYLGARGAVPADVAVFAPLLVDPVADLSRLLRDRLAAAEDDLCLAVGPAAGRLAEHHRGPTVAEVTDRHLCFTTPRHSLDEQLAVLARARDAARSGRAAVLLGPLPDPADVPAIGQVLGWLPANPYAVRVILLGPKDLGAVIRWWRFASTDAQVPVTLEVALDRLTLGGERLSDEERLLRPFVTSDGRDDFARALLAHL